MHRTAFYARYSSGNQWETSIEGQFRLREEHAAREDWVQHDPEVVRTTASGLGLHRLQASWIGRRSGVGRAIEVMDKAAGPDDVDALHCALGVGRANA